MSINSVSSSSGISAASLNGATADHAAKSKTHKGGSTHPDNVAGAAQAAVLQQNPKAATTNTKSYSAATIQTASSAANSAQAADSAKRVQIIA